MVQVVQVVLVVRVVRVVLVIKFVNAYGLHGLNRVPGGRGVGLEGPRASKGRPTGSQGVEG